MHEDNIFRQLRETMVAEPELSLVRFRPELYFIFLKFFINLGPENQKLLTTQLNITLKRGIHPLTIIRYQSNKSDNEKYNISDKIELTTRLNLIIRLKATVEIKPKNKYYEKTEALCQKTD